MKRRDFFKVLLLSSAGLAAPYYLPGLFKKSNYLLQPYENRHTGECGIFAFNFAEGTYRKALTNFNVHNIFYDQDRREFIGINKYGLQFLKFKTIQFDGLEHHVLSTPSYPLSGHVASVPGAEHYYLTASNFLTGKSCVVSLHKSTNSLEHMVDLEASPIEAHDCKFDPQGKQLLVTCGNRVYAFDPRSGGLSFRQFDLVDADSSLRHFSINERRELCVQSNIIYKPDYSYAKAQVLVTGNGGASTALMKEIYSTVADNELLDFEFNATGDLFAAVHGGSRHISLWQTFPLKSFKVLTFPEKVIRVFSSPTSQKEFYVLGRESFYSISLEDFQVRQVEAFQGLLSASYSYSHETLVSI